MRDCEGKLKYENLWLLIRCILSLPHGNAEPERGFSINKSILSIHGFAIKEETLEAIRLVKDFILEKDGVRNMTVSKGMIKSCENARSRYEAYLQEQRKQKELEEAAKKATEEREKSKDAHEQLSIEIEVLKKGIEIAERSIEEGNIELCDVTKSKVINRDKLMSSQNKISMGIKRKAELSTELKELEKRKKTVDV